MSSREHPKHDQPEDVVLLDDLLGEAPLGHPFDDVGARDHQSPPGLPRDTLALMPQRRTMRPFALTEGSSATRPVLRRAKHAATSPGASRPGVRGRSPGA